MNQRNAFWARPGLRLAAGALVLAAVAWVAAAAAKVRAAPAMPVAAMSANVAANAAPTTAHMADGASAQAPAGAAAGNGRPLALVVGFPAATAMDVTARLLQAPLGDALGQAVVVQNKPGAAGNIASEFVARSQPDGHTLLLGNAATHGSNAALYKDLPFDVQADFIPVATVVDVSNVLVVNPAVLDVSTLAGFVRAIGASPGRHNYASSGNGTGLHMAFAEFNHRLGLEMVHVPYTGGHEALNAVLRGEVCCAMVQVQAALPHAATGALRLLGVTTAQRVPAVADVPTIAESGLPGTQGFDLGIWFGVFAPKGTPEALVQRINAVLRQVLSQPAMRARIEGMGNTVRLETPEQFRATVAANRRKWADVVRAANIQIN